MSFLVTRFLRYFQVNFGLNFRQINNGVQRNWIRAPGKVLLLRCSFERNARQSDQHFLLLTSS